MSAYAGLIALTWRVAVVLGALLFLTCLLGPGQRGASATGCTPSRPHGSGDYAATIESGGHTRTYALHIPATYDGARATPLVLNLHGYTDDGATQAWYSELPYKADAAGFILVSPDGMETTFDPGRHWNFTTLEQLIDPGAADDVAFVRQLLDVLESQLCIDTGRVFATGFSNGAFMTSRLACNLSDRIVAIAPVAGVSFPPWSPDLAFEPGCLSTRPVPVIAFHGTDDSRVPFSGGLFPPGYVLHIRNVESEIIPDWAAHNGCDSQPTLDQVSEHVRRVSYGGCDQGATVELFVVEEGGHTWPGTTVFRPGLGATTQEITANDLMWQFFEDHSVVAKPTPTPTSAPPSLGGVAFYPDTASESGTRAAIVAAVLAPAVALAAVAAGWRVRNPTGHRRLPSGRAGV